MSRLMKKLPMFRIGPFLKFCVILGLSLYTASNVLDGPVKNFLRNGTIIRENELNLSVSEEAIVWPSLSICTNPFILNVENYQELLFKLHSKGFANESEYNVLTNASMATRPEDFILALNMAYDFGTSVGNLTRLPVKPPYVKTVLVDYTYNGYCAVVSFEAIRQYLIDVGEVDSGEKDFTFNFVAFLNGDNMPANGEFYIKLVMDGEDSLVGTETISKSNQISINPQKMTILLMELELEKHLRHCNNVRRLTPCVEKFYYEKYGTGFENVFDRLNDKIAIMFGGYSSLIENTYCYMPCERTKYHLKEFLSFQMDRFLDPDVRQFLEDNSDISLIPGIMISHEKSQTIMQHEEVMEYDAIRLISDVGGIVGIFVGLSFWSLYLDFLAPMLSWAENKMQNMNKS